MVMELIIQSLQILLPAYVANGSPPFLIRLKKHPIDFGLKLGSERVFGDGKTIEGFILASLMGYLTGLLEIFVISQISYPNFLQIPPIAFFFIGMGAMFGDLIGSFIKRRMKMKRGANAGLLDMEDFIIGSLVFAAFFVEYSPWVIVISLLITPVVHRIANIIGYKIGVKKEPW